jgi:hypothetical protein
MSRSISVPDDLFTRLERLAQPFVDREPADVIRRLVDLADTPDRPGNGRPRPRTAISRATLKRLRAPRERGVQVELDGETITADSVRDLYDQVLRHLVRNGRLDSVRHILPFRTSASRYLIADRPLHPSGKSFVVPVEQRGLYMEAHKSYSTAVAQLASFLSKIGITLEYVS